MCYTTDLLSSFSLSLKVLQVGWGFQKSLVPCPAQHRVTFQGGSGSSSLVQLSLRSPRLGGSSASLLKDSSLNIQPEFPLLQLVISLLVLSPEESHIYREHQLEGLFFPDNFYATFRRSAVFVRILDEALNKSWEWIQVLSRESFSGWLGTVC